MERLSDSLVKFGDGYAHWCPGCDEMHYIAVDKPLQNGAAWTFDGNVNAPTFTPSIHITRRNTEARCDEVCHYFVTAGSLIFCSDTTHELAGKTVAIPDYPDDA